MWNFFTMVNENYAKCDICKKMVSYETSISNLKRHMLRMHPTVNNNITKHSGQRDLTTKGISHDASGSKESSRHASSSKESTEASSIIIFD